jgi:hypothetical protein
MDPGDIKNLKANKFNRVRIEPAVEQLQQQPPPLPPLLLLLPTELLSSGRRWFARKLPFRAGKLLCFPLSDFFETAVRLKERGRLVWMPAEVND